MNGLADGAAGMLRKTVAVVDMVGYSNIARILEQNISAASVSDLNNQIQSFISRALAMLPEPQTHTVVARTGDGIILLFDAPDAAHTFASALHRFAKEHNNRRTESSAERWFRVGIATGDVSLTTNQAGAAEYAGTTIANAVRLEAATGPGTVMIDALSFAELSPGFQQLYGPEETVRGKHEESFNARRYIVTGTATTSPIPPADTPPRTIARRLLLGAVYLIPLAGLFLWQHGDHLAAFTPTCDPPPDVVHSIFYSVPYKFLLGRASGDAVSNVTLVAIPASLTDIQTNLCQGRLYLADLLSTIAAQHPAEIVVDKFFGPDSCKAFPQTTAALLSAVQSASVPILVAESTDFVATRRYNTCLVREPQLDFASQNVHHGLIRLFTDLDKIPLQWPVLKSDEASNSPDAVSTSDTLPWAAVKIFAPDFASRPRMKALVDSPTDPLANLNIDLLRQTSTQVLCTAGTQQMRSRWATDCSHPVPAASLAGKIVVIGAEDLADQKMVLGSKVWGFDLQGRYINALLSGAYLRELSVAALCAVFIGFLLFMEGIPVALQAFLPHLRDHALLRPVFRQRRILWVLFSAIAFIRFTMVFCLGLGYLPPLPVFGDIVLVVFARLLIIAAGSSAPPIPQPK